MTRRVLLPFPFFSHGQFSKEIYFKKPTQFCLPISHASLPTHTWYFSSARVPQELIFQLCSTLFPYCQCRSVSLTRRLFFMGKGSKGSSTHEVQHYFLDEVEEWIPINRYYCNRKSFAVLYYFYVFGSGVPLHPIAKLIWTHCFWKWSPFRSMTKHASAVMKRSIRIQTRTNLLRVNSMAAENVHWCCNDIQWAQ